MTLRRQDAAPAQGVPNVHHRSLNATCLIAPTGASLKPGNQSGQLQGFRLFERAMNAQKLSRRQALVGAGLLIGTAAMGEKPLLGAEPGRPPVQPPVPPSPAQR